jgi:glycosyltransferase involved in cell wall biosynthesis
MAEDPQADLLAADPLVADRTLTDSQVAARPVPARLLSVIVPVYNERATVAEIVRRMRRVELPMDLEIIMVDDGSSDGTEDILAALEDSTVQVVRHATNRGKGAAVRSGLARSRGDLVLLQDGDLEYDPQDWHVLLAPVLDGGATIVYGSRFAGGHAGVRLSTRVGRRCMSLATELLFDTKLSDMECGYKLFDRRVLDGIVIESDRFDFDPELTAKVLRAGGRIHEVPVSYTPRASHEGRKFSFQDRFRTLWALGRFRWQRP